MLNAGLRAHRAASVRSQRRESFWASFMAVARKEALHIRRDKSALVAALVLPLLQLALFGAVDMTVKRLPTVVVEQSHSHFGRELIAKVGATGTFDVTAVVPDVSAARHQLAAGRARVALVIPPDHPARRARREPAPLFVLIDGSDAAVTSAALAALNGLAAQMDLDVRASSAPQRETLDLRPLVLYNPAGRTAVFLLPGIAAILLQLAAVVQTTNTIVRERERGTLEQLLVTPVSPRGLMLGKIFPYLTLGMGEAVVILVGMRLLFAIPIAGNAALLAVAIVVYLFALLALGMFISSLASTQQQANEMAQAFFLPAFFLSGFMFPRAGLPAPLALLGLLFPVTHMMEVMRGVVVRGAALAELWPHFLTLLVMAIGLWWLALRRIRSFTLG